ncbi:MAG: sterol carrier family protein [Bifidobacteriaceae bacterium]|nr:sterol carrier family protein [Bifidobacteriaceae bacterium]
MPVIHDKDVLEGEDSLSAWNDAAHEALAECGGRDASPEMRMTIAPRLARRAMAMAVRYSLYRLEKIAPGPGVEVRVAPYAAVKVLDGPASDPHNLTPPDVIELDPAVWLRMVCGITTWAEEKDAGHITAVGQRDDLSRFLPLVR